MVTRLPASAQEPVPRARGKGRRELRGEDRDEPTRRDLGLLESALEVPFASFGRSLRRNASYAYSARRQPTMDGRYKSRRRVRGLRARGDEQLAAHARKGSAMRD